jgi:hypothetical protein
MLGNIQAKVNSVRATLDEFKIRRRLNAAPPVLIYQMGKVGSSSLTASLEPTWPGLTIHTHNLLTTKEKRTAARLVYECVIRKGGPVFVISPVREPIGRNISAFFQNFERATGVKYQNSTLSIDQMIRLFLKNHKHLVPLTWFDMRLRPLFGIDVYEHEFFSSGTRVIENENIKLLLMRCEVADAVKESVVRSFLGMPEFVLSSSNVGSSKPYAEAYRKFMEAFLPPDWYMHDMYESRYFKHFYNTLSDDFIRKWTQK